MRNWIKNIFSGGGTAEKSPSPAISPDNDTAGQSGPNASLVEKQQGDMHLGEGNFAAAVTAYRRAIAFDHNHAKAHSNLGFALKEQGHAEEAEKHLHTALALDPGIADAHYLLGLLSQERNNPDAACRHFQQAVALAPDLEFAYRDWSFVLLRHGMLDEARAVIDQGAANRLQVGELYHHLGDALQAANRLQDAILCYRLSLAGNAGAAETFYALGNALTGLGQLEEAATQYRHALDIRPDFTEVHFHLAGVLTQQGQLNQAISSYRQAIDIHSDFAEAHCNLASVLIKQGQLEAAIASCRKALEIIPDFAEAHCNMSVAFMASGQNEAAVASSRAALKIMPDLAEAHCNLTSALHKLGRLEETIASCRQALASNPQLTGVHNNLGFALQDTGELDEAVASFREALRINPDYFEARSNLLFASHYLPAQSARAISDEAMRFGEIAARHAHPYTHWQNTVDVNRRLRIGLVSGDFRQHAVGYFIEGILAAFANDSSSQLHIVAYPTLSTQDNLTQRIKKACHDWRPVADLNDQQFAELVRHDDIDILIDLSGHTAHNRLPVFAWKPAPVQVSWLGYFATTGVAAIDYLIADMTTLPESEDKLFIEKIWRLPETRLCFTVPEVDIPVSLLPALSNNRITFGCFNNLSKMNDNVVALWSKILATIPDSRLILKAKQLGEATIRNRIIERFIAHGIAADRLILEGPTSRAQYLSDYQRVDIVLDPFPYTGGTTTAESLWMGVPVITLSGDNFLARQGVGLLKNAGLTDWIAKDADDYVTRAVSHANDLPSLAALRSRLRQQVLASPIFDAPRFANNLETALRSMWKQWCNQQSSPHG